MTFEKFGKFGKNPQIPSTNTEIQPLNLVGYSRAEVKYLILALLTSAGIQGCIWPSDFVKPGPLDSDQSSSETKNDSDTIDLENNSDIIDLEQDISEIDGTVPDILDIRGDELTDEGLEIDPGCEAISDSDSTCDGIDDDCDGELDEDYDGSCGLGVCLNEESYCVNGSEICVPFNPEVSDGEDNDCDGLDNDCDGEADEDPKCGDDVCNGLEDEISCARDCLSVNDYCGDGYCNANTESTYDNVQGKIQCVSDCGEDFCGDGECQTLNDTEGNYEEDCTACALDCGACPGHTGELDGNGVCDQPQESCLTNPSDCGNCNTKCGDGACQSDNEDELNCHMDCCTANPCTNADIAGDGMCTGDENKLTNPSDCGEYIENCEN